MSPRQDLEQAYRATSYRVGKLQLRIGEPHPWLDMLLENRGLEHYAYLTAWNPRSEPRPDAENRAAMRQLATELEGWVVLRGEAVSDAGDWPAEPSYLVLGIGLDDALALARAHEQNAILHGRVGDAPRLVWVRER